MVIVPVLLQAVVVVANVNLTNPGGKFLILNVLGRKVMSINRSNATCVYMTVIRTRNPSITIYL
jgi:hypothetical protein